MRRDEIDVTCYFEVHSLGELAGPAYAKADISLKTVQYFDDLASVARLLNVALIENHDGPEWGPSQLSLCYDRLVVDRDSFWWSASDKHVNSERVETLMVSLVDLRQAIEEALDKANGQPVYFAGDKAELRRKIEDEASARADSTEEPDAK